MIGPVLLLVLAQAPAGPPPYWQQRLEYDITATLDEPTGTLSGRQRVRYHNNSPDTLRSISFHLYLNAFRPGSRWSDADSAEGRRRFNDLKDPDYGFNRVADAVVDGRTLTPVYPFAPDSTIVRYALPAPIAPGDSFDVSLDWAARPSTVARRQGRRGRHYDFAQWYPRVVAYDRFGWAEHPLYPAGEFYGDFGEFRVTLDVPADQVVGATGVPVCGDPGWERANRVPAGPVALGRDAYGAPSCGDVPAAAAGRKTMLWVARDVHHFVMSMDPAYLYEGGRFGDALVHVLYRPGDERSWGGGIAVERTETALRWLDGLFGKYPWPQITNVHRIDGGGTEFPMMVHNGSAGLGLILHEVGHNYLMGILANNEWREGFLDEGFTSFQTTWFEETQGARGGAAALDSSMVLSDVDGWSEPTSLVSERYRDFGTYNAMIYDRGELFYHQLRAMVGDSVMRAILRTFYDRWRLKHVDEAAFRAVAEEVSHRDLSTFFGQFLHSVVLYDYGVGRVERDRLPDGQWRTRVEVLRHAPGRIP
ncbi:MAG TPA: M1 family metallopeptidase, partial [Gemmatimonadales bacterium]